jgi:TonB family protein
MFGLSLILAAGFDARAQSTPAPPASGPQLTKAPELVTFVEAPFPASELGNTGSVVLFIVIRDDGTVEDATVRATAGAAFDEAAVAAARQFVFSPAEVDGAPARIGIEYQYDFVEKVVAPTTGIFTGVVKDREAHVALPGVTVTLGDGRTVTTDA